MGHPNGASPGSKGHQLSLWTEDQRRFLVTARESVYSKGCLVGHVCRTFYYNLALKHDRLWLWEEWEESEELPPSRFTELCLAERFTERQADAVVELVRRQFPRLSCVRRVLVVAGQHETPLRMYPNDGGYSQWNTVPYSEELGFPIGAFADFEDVNSWAWVRGLR